MKLHPIAAACALALLGSTATACSLTESKKEKSASADRRVTVTSSADACELSTTSAPSGHLVFTVKNTGSQVTEFYLYAADGKKIVAEVENIGPGLSRELVVTAEPGKYVTACKPGMKGAGIRGDFTVTDSGHDGSARGADPEQVEQATEAYAAFVRAQSEELLERTRQFAAAYTAGQDHRARKLYAHAREPWERIEPVAESFGDLDPKMDARQVDLEQGQEWTGWHRIEKELWFPRGMPHDKVPTTTQRKAWTEDLLANTRTLHERVQHMDFGVDQIGNGAKELLDEVATGKVTGEEEIWSHTDLYDFQANVDGARKAYTVLRPILEDKDPALSRRIAAEFADLQELLDHYRTGEDDFVSYDEVTEAQRKQLSDAVNALAEPLSRMTGAVTL